MYFIVFNFLIINTFYVTFYFPRTAEECLEISKNFVFQTVEAIMAGDRCVKLPRS